MFGINFKEKIPIQPAIIDFLQNIVHLRLFFVSIAILLILSNSLILIMEFECIQSIDNEFGVFFNMMMIMLDDITPAMVSDYNSSTRVGNILRFFNGILGFLVFILIFWSIHASISDQIVIKIK